MRRTRAYTLIELLITIAILGILATLVAGSSGVGCGCNANYSNGSRAGVVVKFSKKGDWVKSWEGELLVGGTATNAVSNVVWAFSVEDDAVATKVQEALDSGKRVSLKYHQYRSKPRTLDTPYVVEDVTYAKVSKE